VLEENGHYLPPGSYAAGHLFSPHPRRGVKRLPTPAPAARRPKVPILPSAPSPGGRGKLANLSALCFGVNSETSRTPGRYLSARHIPTAFPDPGVASAAPAAVEALLAALLREAFGGAN
jgi:hypothetical protein